MLTRALLAVATIYCLLPAGPGLAADDATSAVAVEVWPEAADQALDLLLARLGMSRSDLAFPRDLAATELRLAAVDQALAGPLETLELTRPWVSLVSHAPELPDVGRHRRIVGSTVQIESSQPTDDLRILTDWACARGAELEGLELSRPSLEDVYLDLTGDGAARRAEPGAGGASAATGGDRDG